MARGLQISFWEGQLVVLNKRYAREVPVDLHETTPPCSVRPAVLILLWKEATCRRWGSPGGWLSDRWLLKRGEIGQRKMNCTSVSTEASADLRGREVKMPPRGLLTWSEGAGTSYPHVGQSFGAALGREWNMSLQLWQERTIYEQPQDGSGQCIIASPGQNRNLVLFGFIWAPWEILCTSRLRTSSGDMSLMMKDTWMFSW